MANATTNLNLDPAVEARLQRIADARRSSPQALIREAIEQYVEREEVRALAWQDALVVWDDYQKTGLHLTAKEADAWLARLEAGEDVEPPAPHTL